MMRINNFDALRLLGAFLVFGSHHWALQGLPEPQVGGWTTWGGLGVAIFFSISGYLISQSWLRDPHLGRFALRRILRILPGLAVVVTVCVSRKFKNIHGVFVSFVLRLLHWAHGL